MGKTSYYEHMLAVCKLNHIKKCSCICVCVCSQAITFVWWGGWVSEWSDVSQHEEMVANADRCIDLQALQFFAQTNDRAGREMHSNRRRFCRMTRLSPHLRGAWADLT